MAHQLEIRNGGASFASTKPAWHGLGTIVENAMTSKEAIELARLNYQVIKTAIMADVPGVGQFPINDRFATFRTDTNQPLGVVGNRYEIVQNTEAFTFFDSIVGEGKAIFETAGVLGIGERVFISAKMPDSIRIAGTDDLTEVYVLLTSSHDGTGSIVAAVVPIRVVCSNTLNAALRSTISRVSIRHTRNADGKLREAHRLLGISEKYVKELNEAFNVMSRTYVSDVAAKDLIAKLFKAQKADSRQANEAESTRIMNIRADVLRSYMTGVGQEGIIGTAWGLYNGVTHYFDHMKNYRDAELKLDGLMTGQAYQKQQEAFDLLMAVS